MGLIGELVIAEAMVTQNPDVAGLVPDLAGGLAVFFGFDAEALAIDLHVPLPFFKGT